MTNERILRQARKEVEALFLILGNGLSGNEFMDEVVNKVVLHAVTKARKPCPDQK
jgi:hypothetical protein